MSGFFKHRHLKIPYFVLEMNTLTEGVCNCMINSRRLLLSVGGKSFGSSGFAAAAVPSSVVLTTSWHKQCLNIQTVITARQKSSNGHFIPTTSCLAHIDQQFKSSVNIYMTKNSKLLCLFCCVLHINLLCLLALGILGTFSCI